MCCALLLWCCWSFVFFFFKQKTAYEMRISDWSSDVCSSDLVEALVIGGGFGGLLAAAELHKIGVTDIRIVEKAGDFGGTWYWNRYPGAQCDIESYIYMPLLEETGYVPSEK